MKRKKETKGRTGGKKREGSDARGKKRTLEAPTVGSKKKRDRVERKEKRAVGEGKKKKEEMQDAQDGTGGSDDAVQVAIHETHETCDTCGACETHGARKGCKTGKREHAAIHRLAVACVFRDGAFYLREWIEHYLLMGATRFYLCDHLSADGGAQLLAPYIEAGVVVLMRCEREVVDDFDAEIRVPFYESVLHAVRGDVEWVACIDIDEFAVPVRTDDTDLVAVLDRHRDDAPVLYANWRMYGTSDIPDLPADRLIVEALVKRAADDAPYHRFVKPFVQPSQFARMIDTQLVLATDGTAGRFTDGTPRGISCALPTRPIVDQLCINHYITGTVGHFETVKVPLYERLLPPGPMLHEAVTRASDGAFCDLEDTTAAERFGPALRQRLFGSTGHSASFTVAPDAPLGDGGATSDAGRAVEDATACNGDQHKGHPHVCLIFHMGTLQEWAFYRPYVHNLRRAYVAYDMYVTLLHEAHTPDMVRRVQAFHRGAGTVGPGCVERPVEFIPMENRGLDTGAFLLAVQRIEKLGRTYEYVVKVHTKTTRHGSGWRQQLTQAVLGSPVRIFHSIKTMDNDPSVGMIGLRDWLQTDGPRDDVDAVAERIGVKTRGENTFIGGSMFWARFAPMADALRGLDAEAFLATCHLGQPAGHAQCEAHMLERIMGNLITDAGYQVRGAIPDPEPSVASDAEIDAMEIENSAMPAPSDPFAVVRTQVVAEGHDEQVDGRAIPKHAEHAQASELDETAIWKWSPRSTRALALGCTYAAAVSTDINEHMGLLFDVARHSTHVTELAAGCGGGSWALALGLAYGRIGGAATGIHGRRPERRLISVDMGPLMTQAPSDDGATPQIAEERRLFGKACKRADISVDMRVGNTALVDIEETDVLLIDSWHVCAHVTEELERHHEYVRWRIVLHDTTVDAEVGESVRMGHDIAHESERFGYKAADIERGIWPAIEDFVGRHPVTWRLAHRWTHCNGLAVLERVR